MFPKELRFTGSTVTEVGAHLASSLANDGSAKVPQIAVAEKGGASPWLAAAAAAARCRNASADSYFPRAFLLEVGIQARELRGLEKC